MVPCHRCHIYEIWTSRSKKVLGMLKSHRLGVAKATKGGLFSYGRQVLTMKYCYIVKLYCKSYWLYTLTNFIRYLFFTILLLFYVHEVGKAKSAIQSVLMILTLNGLFQKKILIFFTLGHSKQNKASLLETPHNWVTPFRNFKA